MKIRILSSIILISLVLPAFVIGQGNLDLPKPGLTPDSPFYFLDTVGKKISLFFTFAPEKKAGKAIQFAEERLAEAQMMGEKNKTKALASANQAYQEYLSLANQKTREAKEQGKDVEELAILITEKTLKHQEVLIDVFEKVPEEAKAAIETAIQTSRRGSEEAVQAVSGAKKDELLQKIEETRIRAEERMGALEERMKSLEEQLRTRIMETEAKAEKLIKEAEIAKEEAEKAKLLAEAEKVRLEAEKAKLETEKLRKELEQTQKLTAKKKEEIKEVKLSIERITPNQILNNIDNYLTISGYGIQQGTEVIIAGINFGSGNVIDNKTITVKLSSGRLTPNIYSVQIVNPDGKTDILYDSLTIIKPQSQTSIPQPTPTPQPQPEPIPTPTPTLEPTSESTPTSTTPTPTLTPIIPGSITISVDSTPGDRVIVIGSVKVDVSLVGLVFIASAEEDIRITQLKLTISSSGQVSNQDVSNIAIYDGSTILTSKKGWDSPTIPTVTFTASDFLNSSGIGIISGSTKTLTIKGDILVTATNNHSIAIGINSVDDITTFGLTSNTEITEGSIPGPNSATGLNYDVNNNADNLYEAKLISKGSLTIIIDSNIPNSTIKTVGLVGVVASNEEFLKINFSASSGEDIGITSIAIQRNGGRDANFEGITIWEGSTQVGAKQTLTNGLATFNISPYWRITKNQTKTLTIKGNLNGIGTSGSTTGDSPKLCILANGVTALGVSSGVTPTISGLDSDICGNEMILRKSKPTIVADSFGSILGVGEKMLHRWMITTNSVGDIAWKRIIFDMSGSVQIGSDTYTIGLGDGASTDGVYMGTSTTPSTGLVKQLIAADSIKVYDAATGAQIQGSVSVQNYTTEGGYMAGEARISFTADIEQVIDGGTTKNYALKGYIGYDGKAGDAISTRITRKSNNVIAGSYTNIANTEATLVWTDRSTISHSESSPDWTNDYKVPGLSTAPSTLNK